MDDTGFVFTWNGRLFRGIYERAAQQIRDIMRSGLLTELQEKKLFPDTLITDYHMEGCSIILEHRKISPVTYPYEWPFSMFKQAAITMLEINQIARKYHYQTKDCHSYNILFDGLNPTFVDLGSFVKMEQGAYNWLAYEEFVQHYVYPLQIWHDGNYYFTNKILVNSYWDLPHESYLYYRYTLSRLFGPKLLRKMATNYFKFRRLSTTSTAALKKAKLPTFLKKVIITFQHRQVLPLQTVDFSKLIKRIDRISRPLYWTEWKDYQKEFIGECGKITPSDRFNHIMRIIDFLAPASILELGGNMGLLSMLLKARHPKTRVICTDKDENVVDLLYSSSRNRDIGVIPAILDCVHPVHNFNTEPPDQRFSSDLVLVLALTHHLLLKQKIRINLVFDVIRHYSTKYVLIEFMPKGLWDGKNEPSLPDYYNFAWFKAHFEKYFDLVLIQDLEPNRTLFVGMTRPERL